MKEAIAAFLCGLLFAVGLGISGMTQPGVVTGFLDFLGVWNASLLFVMVGAILVYSIGFRLVVKRPEPLVASQFNLPTLRKIDRSLLLGSAIFGIGWGLAGFCPGPGLTSLSGFGQEAALFVLSMLSGMFIYQSLKK